MGFRNSTCMDRGTKTQGMEVSMYKLLFFGGGEGGRGWKTCHSFWRKGEDYACLFKVHSTNTQKINKKSEG